MVWHYAFLGCYYVYLPPQGSDAGESGNVVPMLAVSVIVRFVSLQLCMVKFNSWWIPLITSATGILFWYEVMHFAAARIGEVIRLQ